jgi:hypothetical protein
VKNASLKAKPASDNILKWIFNPQSNHPLMLMIQPQFVQQVHFVITWALLASVRILSNPLSSKCRPTQKLMNP